MPAFSEDAFLARLLPRLASDIPVPPGDDCAAIPWREGTLLLLAVDQVAEGVHFYGPDAGEPTPPGLAGRKLLARNLSDIAAMGGRPTVALLTIATPRDRDAAWLDAFADGLLALAERVGVRLIGGDTGRADAFVATLTILGEVAAERVCRRDAALAGDVVVATGAFGGSLASGRHLSFDPRLAEGAWLAEGGWTRAMLDVSDGLLKDLGRLAAASGLQARLDLAAIPRHADLPAGGAVNAGLPEDAGLAAALLDGEDYELLFALPAARLPALLAAWPFATPLTAIATLAPPPAGSAADSGHTAAPLVVDAATGRDLRARFPGGFEHFA